MKLDKKSIVYKALKNNGILLGIIFFSGSSVNLANPVGLLIVLGLAILGVTASAAWNYLYWQKYEYEITEDTFDIVSGVLRRDRREIPLHRIQNVDITQNFVLRIISLAQVNLETAGGGQTEASLKYVTYDEAKRIQKKVRQLKSGRSIDQEEEEAEAEQDVLFELQSEELALLSLTSVNIQAVAGIFFLLSIFGGVVGGFLDAVGAGAQIVLLIAVAGLAGVAWISGALVTFNKYYGFQLTEADDTIEYERGLLKRASGSIPRNKIQSIKIEENPLQRLIDYSTVKIDTAGYSPSTAAEMGSEAAVPLAKRSRALDLGRKLHGYGELDLKSIPGRAFRRYAFRYSVLVFMALGLGYVSQRFVAWNYWLILALLPVALLAAYLKWINKAYLDGEEFFYTMNGFWNRATTITPYYRLQTLISSRTIFQRRLGLITMVFDTAGESILGNNPKAVDIDSEEAEEVYESVLERFKISLSQ